MGDALKAKVMSMQVLPYEVAHLCFEVSGILGYTPGQLGDTVKAFDYDAFYTKMRAFPTNGGDPSRLWYDSTRLESEMLEFDPNTMRYMLSSLRAEPTKAALDKAINDRQNAYFAKYAHSANIIAKITSLYSPANSTSKYARLLELGALANQQANALDFAYKNTSRDGVVRQTFSELASTTVSSGTAGESTSSSGSTYDERVGSNDDAIDTGTSKSTGSVTSKSQGSATQRQSIYNTDYAYRYPAVENLAQNHRTQISLTDELFEHYMYVQNLPYLNTVFKNELSSLDTDIYRLQVNYLNTLLMSPINGRITGVYKYPGDAVQAGEPVLRVENEYIIRIAAQLKFPGRIKVGDRAYLETNEFENNGLPGGVLTTLNGPIVAARGDTEDDRWVIVINATNVNASGHIIFPMGYQFDYDNTSVSIESV